MSDGSEFQVRGAGTKNARRASSLHVLGTVSSGASDDRRGRTGTAVWIRSLKYAGVEEDIVLRGRENEGARTRVCIYPGVYSSENPLYLIFLLRDIRTKYRNGSGEASQ